VNGKAYLGSTFRRDGVDELFYGDWIDIGGVQITFAPSILLQHALGAAHLPPWTIGARRGLAPTLHLQYLEMPRVTLLAKPSAMNAAPSALAI
jgi:hypothetical protein